MTVQVYFFRITLYISINGSYYGANVALENTYEQSECTTRAPNGVFATEYIHQRRDMQFYRCCRSISSLHEQSSQILYNSSGMYLNRIRLWTNHKVELELNYIVLTGKNHNLCHMYFQGLHLRHNSYHIKIHKRIFEKNKMVPSHKLFYIGSYFWVLNAPPPPPSPMHPAMPVYFFHFRILADITQFCSLMQFKE